MNNKEYYFKHDYNPTNDPKIVCLLSDYKSLGYALFWRIIEMMHQADNNKLPFKNHIFNSIALQMYTSVEQVKAFVNSCINDYELFQKDDDFFWSERVLRNIEDMNDLSEKRRQAAKKSWENRKTNASAMQSKALQCNKNKINKNKINKNKINNIEIDSSPSQINNKFFNDEEYQNEIINKISDKYKTDINFVKSEVKKFVSYWTEPNKSGTKVKWQKQDTFEITRRLATWFNNIKNFNSQSTNNKIWGDSIKL